MREMKIGVSSSTMRALRVHEWGDLSRITLESISIPSPQQGEVLIRMGHSGLNFMDIYTVRGTYKDSRTYPVKLPLTIGMEGAGRVEALGSGVDTVKIGDTVSFCLHWGAHAEWATVPASHLVCLPDSIGTDIAAAVTFSGITAHYLAHDLADLHVGDWALVWSGAGGIAQLLTQMLRRMGVHVVATASSEQKAEAIRRNGADIVLSPTDPDFEDRVREATGGGAAIVYDTAGRATINTSLRSLRRRGTLSLVGTNSGPVPTLDVAALMEAGSIRFIRPRLADFIATQAEFKRRSDAVMEAIVQGDLQAAPAAIYPFPEARAPLAQLIDRTAIGKSVMAY
jgi:NADPH:quinone reductase